jgi:hypothetical protein
MSRHLTETVLAGGRILPAGASESEALGVPDGPWWSESTKPEPEATTPKPRATRKRG